MDPFLRKNGSKRQRLVDVASDHRRSKTKNAAALDAAMSSQKTNKIQACRGQAMMKMKTKWNLGWVADGKKDAILGGWRNRSPAAIADDDKPFTLFGQVGCGRPLRGCETKPVVYVFTCPLLLRNETRTRCGRVR